MGMIPPPRTVFYLCAFSQKRPHCSPWWNKMWSSQRSRWIFKKKRMVQCSFVAGVVWHLGKYAYSPFFPLSLTTWIKICGFIGRTLIFLSMWSETRGWHTLQDVVNSVDQRFYEACHCLHRWRQSWTETRPAQQCSLWQRSSTPEMPHGGRDLTL